MISIRTRVNPLVQLVTSWLEFPGMIDQVEHQLGDIECAPILQHGIVAVYELVAKAEMLKGPDDLGLVCWHKGDQLVQADPARDVDCCADQECADTPPAEFAIQKETQPTQMPLELGAKVDRRVANDAVVGQHHDWKDLAQIEVC